MVKFERVCINDSFSNYNASDAVIMVPSSQHTFWVFGLALTTNYNLSIRLGLNTGYRFCMTMKQRRKWPNSVLNDVDFLSYV